MEVTKKNQLVIIRGLPGSGKSTTAKSQFPNHKHIEADQYFLDVCGNYVFKKTQLHNAHNWCYETVCSLLNTGYDVVVSNTFTTIHEMKPYYDLSKTITNIELKILTCIGDFGSIHNVPNDTILRMKKRWQELPEDWKVNFKAIQND
mgnify:FL=1